MNRSLLYSDYLDLETGVENWLKDGIAALELFKKVSGSIGDLIDNPNYPLCVVFNDDLDFGEAECVSTISVSIRNRGESTEDNKPLTKAVLDILAKRKMGGTCQLESVKRVENFIDTTSGAKIGVKAIITRIEVEVTL